MADKDKVPPATDLTRWRLSVAKGRQTWRYIDEEEAEINAITFLEKHFLGINKEVINNKIINRSGRGLKVIIIDFKP